MKTVAIQLVLACRDCRGDMLVGTLSDTLECAQCRAVNPIEWRGVLDVELRGERISLVDVLPGLVDGREVHGSSATVKVNLRVEPARCACGIAIDEQALAKVNRLRPTIACSCGRSIAARRPPDALVTVYPDLLYVIGEREVPTTTRQGVVIACGECGATLDGTTCPHCGTVNARPAGAGASIAAPRFWLALRATGS